MIVKRNNFSRTIVSGYGWHLSWFSRCLAAKPCSVVLLVFSLLYCASGFAQDRQTIIVVPTKQGGVYREFINSFRDSLADSGGGSAALIVVESGNINASLFNSKNVRLIVSVGTVATQKVFKLNKSVPVLSTLVPRSSYRVLDENARHRGKQYTRSAIHLDQPIARHMGLIHAILPNKKTVSVVLGPNTRFLQAELKSAARNEGMRIQIETMGYAQRLIGPLNRALEESDAFIAIADNVVSNRKTVQNLLLTTYRQKVPVIGYSRAYVRAGALAAVYSTPEQIGRQAGELVGGLIKQENWSLPAPLHPRYFSVEINREVARSLGISVPQTKLIENRLRAADRGA